MHVVGVRTGAPVAMHHMAWRKPKGAVKFSKLQDVIEKPAPGDAPQRPCVAARYVFSPRFSMRWSERGGKAARSNITDAMRLMIGEAPRFWEVRLRPGEPSV